MKDFNDQTNKLIKALGASFTILIQFVVIFVLTALLVLVKVFPFALRALSVIVWIAAIGYSAISTWLLYARISDNFIGNALSCVLFAAIVAVIPVAIGFSDSSWGAYAFAAVCGFGIGYLANQFGGRIEYYAILRLVPNAIAVVGLIGLASARTHNKRGENHA